jgi:cell division protein ZipA
MDNFRWILLGVGVLFVIIVYLISRKNRRDFYQEDDSMPDELPQLNASNWDEFDEGVGEVRVIARANDDLSVTDKTASSHSYRDELDDEDAHDPLFASKDTYRFEPEARPEPEFPAEPEAEIQGTLATDTARQPPAEDVRQQAGDDDRQTPTETVLVLNIIARDGSHLSGKSINSVAHANNMVFGDMSIYHRMDQNNQPVFSMINMVKPGMFDPETIHELETPGVSLFLQLPGPANASAALDDMLRVAYRMSDTLEARLCDKSRQPLTESVVDEYRHTAASFDGQH